jgi:hypothetical protein
MRFKLYRNGNYVGTYEGSSSDSVIATMVKRMKRVSKTEAAKDKSTMIAEYTAKPV